MASLGTWQSSERAEVQKIFGVVGTGTPLLPLCSVTQNKLQGRARHKEWGIDFVYLLMGEAAKSNIKGHGYFGELGAILELIYHIRHLV